MRGTIEKRLGRDGKTVTWTARWSYLDPLTGERKWRRLSAPTKGEAERLLATELAKARQGPTDDKITLREWAERWLAETAHRVRPSTHRRYRDLLVNHALPRLGHLRLAKLSSGHLSRLYAEKLADGLSPSTVHYLHVVLSGCLKSAERAGITERDVSRLVSPPRPAPAQTNVWTVEQARVFLAVTDATPLAALWRLALLCGLRRGELLGLTWDDIDLDRGALAVHRALAKGAAGWELTAPKTAAGRRSVALPASCVAALRAHRLAQDVERARLGDLWRDGGFVFTGAVGQPLHVNTLSAAYERALKAAGVPRIRLHDLRHTCATLLLAAGAHPRVVQERLGHSTVQITLDRYSHVAGNLQREAAAALDVALGAPDFAK